MSGALTGTRSDADGRFAFPELATRGTVLELQHESFFIRHVALADHPNLEEMEIVQPSLCELQVELVDASSADRIEVLDASGEPLQILEHFGAFLGAGDSASFEDGKTNVLQVSELARTLVLSKAGVEVVRRSLDLDPQARRVLRF